MHSIDGTRGNAGKNGGTVLGNGIGNVTQSPNLIGSARAAPAQHQCVFVHLFILRCSHAIPRAACDLTLLAGQHHVGPNKFVPDSLPAYDNAMLSTLRSLGPRLNQMFRPRGKVFFGWWIVAAASGIQWLAAMTWMHSYGAYALSMQAEFGWSMTLLSSAFALTRLESGLLGPLQGWLVDKYGPRVILSIGTLIFGIGFFLFAAVDSVVTYFAAFVLIALGSSLGGWATLMVSLVNWFNQHRAKAVAWSQIGFSLGGLSVPLVVWSMEIFGWRATAMASGFAVLLVAGPLVLLVRHRPEEIGEVADGIEQPRDAQGNAPPPQTSFTWREAVREPSFWLVSAGHALSLLAVSSMLMHLIPHLTKSLHYTPVQASFVFGFMTGVQLIGLFLGGFLGDRLDKRLLCVCCMFGHTLGLLALAHGGSIEWIVAFVLLHGMGWGVRGPLMVALRADYFGPRSFGTIMGISSLIVMLGMTSGPLICGYPLRCVRQLHGGLYQHGAAVVRRQRVFLDGKAARQDRMSTRATLKYLIRGVTATREAQHELQEELYAALAQVESVVVLPVVEGYTVELEVADITPFTRFSFEPYVADHVVADAVRLRCQSGEDFALTLLKSRFH